MSGEKKILYVFNKEPGYSRIKLIRSALQAHGRVDEIHSVRRSYFGRTIEVLWRFIIHAKREYDVLVVGFFAQLFFPFIRPFWKGPIIADCYISLFDSYVNDRGLASAKSLKGRLCFWADRYLLEHSDILLTDTNEHRKYLGAQFGTDTERIRAIPISADESLFPRLPHASSPSGCFEVLFFGAFIPLQGVETIIRAANLLDRDRFRFRLIGEGQTFAECQALARSINVENVVFEGWKKVEEIAREAETSHLILGIFGQTDKAKRVIPNKVFEALAMGRPLITGDSIAIREYFADGKDIFLVPFDDPKALAEKIEWLDSNYTQVAKIADAGNRVFKEKLSPQSVATLVGEVLRDLR